jgi:hypothetical protein
MAAGESQAFMVLAAMRSIVRSARSAFLSMRV